jgi:hypothetical protein
MQNRDNAAGQKAARTRREEAPLRRWLRLPPWISDQGAWGLVIGVVGILVAIIVLPIGWRHDSADKAVNIDAQLILDPTSGYTGGSSWPIIFAIVNRGPAEAKHVSAYVQLESPQRMRHAGPSISEKAAGATVEIAEHGHGDEYDIDIKNLLPQNTVIVTVEFRAENPALKQELLDKFKKDRLSGAFLTEFVKELSFTGENVESEITAGMLPSLHTWTVSEVQRAAQQAGQK